MHLTIIDKNDILIENEEFLQNDSNLECVWGDDYLEHLDGYDMILKGPGVITKDIDATQYPFTSQLELLLEVARNQVIGITATKGKSTTCSLTYEALKKNGKDVYLLGNIGNPIFDEIEKYQEDTWLVIEMSALQLEFVKYSPHIALILNLYEDHLDHSGTVEHYHANKLNIFKYQDNHDYRIYCKDIEPLNSYMNDSYKGIPYAVTFEEDRGKNITSLIGDKVFLNEKELFSRDIPIFLLGDHRQ